MFEAGAPAVFGAPPSVPAPPVPFSGGVVPPQSSALSHWQPPAAQTKPLVQARPHAPQLAGFVITSVQPVSSQQDSFSAQPGPAAPLQEQALLPPLSRQRSPGRHATRLQWQRWSEHSMPLPLPQSFLKSQLHWPSMQTKPLGHLLPQLPQRAASLLTDVSQPSSGVALQSPHASSQVLTAHASATHSDVAWSSVHGPPQGMGSGPSPAAPASAGAPAAGAPASAGAPPLTGVVPPALVVPACVPVVPPTPILPPRLVLPARVVVPALEVLPPVLPLLPPAATPEASNWSKSWVHDWATPNSSSKAQPARAAFTRSSRAAESSRNQGSARVAPPSRPLPARSGG